MQLGNCPPISYVKRRRQRTIRIRVKHDEVMVSGPWYCRTSEMHAFVSERQEWIRKTVARLSNERKSRHDDLAENRGHILLRGIWVPVHLRRPIPGSKNWKFAGRSGRIDAYPPEGVAPVAVKALVQDNGTRPEPASGYSTVNGNTSGIESPQQPTPDLFSAGEVANEKRGPDLADLRYVPAESLNGFLRQIAEKELRTKFAKLAGERGFSVKKLYLRSQRTKWGTCSSKGNISLNWRLVMCPEFVQEYIILHELCHTRHLNHSKAFWELVSLHCPDYKTAHNWLKKQGNLVFQQTDADR